MKLVVHWVCSNQAWIWGTNMEMHHTRAIYFHPFLTTQASSGIHSKQALLKDFGTELTILFLSGLAFTSRILPNISACVAVLALMVLTLNDDFVEYIA